MREDGTTQNKPKRLRQPYFNAQTTQTRAHTSPLDLRREGKVGACTGKRGNVCMSESGTCIASTSSSLTLRAHYVHHKSGLPCYLVFTCAGGMQDWPNPNVLTKQPDTTLCTSVYDLISATKRVVVL